MDLERTVWIKVARNNIQSEVDICELGYSGRITGESTESEGRRLCSQEPSLFHKTHGKIILHSVMFVQIVIEVISLKVNIYTETRSKPVILTAYNRCQTVPGTV